MIKFGIVGAGSIAHKFAKDIQVVEGVKLVSVASRSIEKAKNFQEEYNLEYAYGSYEDMLNSNTIDAVYIATPHRFHKDNSIMFLEKGIHVLCEKPLAVNEKEVLEMINTAKDNHVLLMEAMWTRYLPAIQKARSIIQSNKLGNVKHLDLSFCADIGLYAPKEGRLLNPNLAGGSLLDVGIYPISLLLFLMGDNIDYKEVSYELFSTGVDKYVEMKGVVDEIPFILRSGFDRVNTDAIIELDKGTIRIPNFYAANKVIVNETVYEFPHRVEGFEYEIESFRDTLLDHSNENNVMSYSESLKIIRNLDILRDKMSIKYPFE